MGGPRPSETAVDLLASTAALQVLQRNGVRMRLLQRSWVDTMPLLHALAALKLLARQTPFTLLCKTSVANEAKQPLTLCVGGPIPAT